MKRVQAFSDLEEAIQALDNGGRFFDIFDKAAEGIVPRTELGKVTGLCMGKQKMTLFLALSLIHLSEGEKKLILDILSPDIQSIFYFHKPIRLAPNKLEDNKERLRNVIVSGIPKRINQDLTNVGFIMLNVMAGSVYAPLMIPVTDLYEVYELSYSNSQKTVIIAHTKGEGDLPERPLTIGGVLKEYHRDREKKKGTALFVEIVYWSA